MPDTAVVTARRLLALAETMRTTNKGLLAYWDASRERDRILASGWPEDAARALVARELGFMPPVRRVAMPVVGEVIREA